MINVSKQILRFRQFLLDSWADLDLLMEDHDWEDDGYFTCEWLQVNWEFLVERQLLKKNGYLNSYGIYYKRKRITNPSAKITHLIVCEPKEHCELIDYRDEKLPPRNLWIFHCFYKKAVKPAKAGGVYPPFDAVSLISPDAKTWFEVSIDTVDFYLCPIDEIESKYLDAWYLK